MSQFFTGLPIGRKRVIFIDSMLVLAIAFALLISGTLVRNDIMLVSGVFLVIFVFLSPFCMSTTFPTSVFMLWDDEEEEKQQ